MSNVETSQPRARSPRIVVDGIIANRNLVRKRGGVVAVAMSASLALLGLILLALPGSLLGILGYLILVIALPVLSIAGIPAVSTFASYAIATLASAAIWFGLGLSNNAFVYGMAEMLGRMRGSKAWGANWA